MWKRDSSSKPPSRLENVPCSRRIQLISVLLREPQHLCDGLRQLRPLFLLFGKALLPRAGDRVETRAAVVRRRVPRRFDPAEMFHAMERRIQRAFLDSQNVVG